MDPLGDKYHYTQKWFFQSEILRQLHKHLPPQRRNVILEIGSYEGLSGCFFSDNFLEHPEASLDCVDPFSTEDVTSPVQTSTEQICRSNLALSDNANKISVHKMFSKQYFMENKKTYNLIYVDGSHLPEDIMDDIHCAFGCIDAEGIIWIDDYLGGNRHPDGTKIIKSAVDEALSDYIDQYQVIHSGYQLAVKIM